MSSTLRYTHEPKLPADNQRYTTFLPPQPLACDRFTFFGPFLLMFDCRKFVIVGRFGRFQTAVHFLFFSILCQFPIAVD